jgi:hypothetical protein
VSARALAAVACAWVAGLGGCSSAGDAGDASSRADASARLALDGSVVDGLSAVDAAPGAEAGDACDGGPSGADAGTVCVARIEGRAVDEGGAPLVAGTLVSACGPTACTPARTSADGAFVIAVAQRIVPERYSVLVHVRPGRAAFYHALPRSAGAVVDMGTLTVLAMPPSGPALVVDRAGAPAQSLTSGEVTLDVPQGVSVRLDVESNLAGALGAELRVRRVPDALVPRFAGIATGVRAMYALEPFESSFELPGAPPTPTDVRPSFSNAARLPAGAAVDVLALGSYVFPRWIAPATFQRVAGAHVSTDGARVELDPGEGVPHLTWIALRLAGASGS